MKRSHPHPSFVVLAALLALAIALVASLASAQDEAPTSEATTSAEGTGDGADAAALVLGQEAYAAHCTRCHGEDGQAGTPIGERMGIPAFNAAHFGELGDEGLLTGIQTGHGERNPAADLSEEQVAAVIAYIHTLAQ